MNSAATIIRRDPREKRYPYHKVFLGGALLYFLAVLPFLIYHGGIFFYYGDYNVQQVPFYILAHRAVRSGNFFWSFKVDLGSPMAGSFAFYLWGSPFFWLSCLFPEKWVPYLTPALMMLKYGTAVTTAYAFLRRHVRTERGALVGGFLYAFSGIFSVNIVFQHFHDAMCFFPLYLLSLEQFVRAERRGKRPDFFRDRLFFVGMTTLMACINYFFFYEQVVFLILWYFFCLVPGSERTPKEILREVLHLLLYGALGLGVIAFYLIQILDVLSGSSRIADMLSGWDLVRYSEPTTYLAILKSLFFVPDIIGRGTLFTSDAVKNSSLSAYLPMFALTGVVAYFIDHRITRQTRLLSVLGIAAMVPVLNAVFAMFNTEYYARWYFLPVLVMVMMTVRELEDARLDSLKKGFFVCLIADIAICLCTLLPTWDEDGSIQWLQMVKYPNLFIAEAVAAVGTLAYLGYFLFAPSGFEKVRVGGSSGGESGEEAAPRTVLVPRVFRPGKNGLLTHRMVYAVLLACLVCTMSVLWSGNSLIARSGGVKWKQQLLDNVPNLPDTEEIADQFYRIEVDGTSTNYEMVWGYPTIHCFQSTVESSIVDFYEGIGRSRTVDSKMNFTHPGARALLSARYYLENILIHQDETYADQGGILGYVQKYETDNGYMVYENSCYIPMGFTFDSYVTEDEYSTVVDNRRLSDRLLVKDLILSDEAAEKYGDLLTRDTDFANADTSDDAFYQNCADRKASSCTAFSYDNDGFSAACSMSRENLLFFSVPWDAGWTATVDGNPVEIVTADFGLMAIDVPAGTHEIRFDFTPAYFHAGCVVSVLSAGVVIALAVTSPSVRRRRRSR